MTVLLALAVIADAVPWSAARGRPLTETTEVIIHPQNRIENFPP